jgi:hypothetical protein
MAQLARSLLAHGKAREAEVWARKAEGAQGGRAAEDARLLLDLVDTREDRDPEIPLAPEGELERPVLPADVAADVAERITREYTAIEAHCRQQRYASAYELVDEWPVELTGHLGQDTALLTAFLHYKTGQWGDAIDQLRPLAADDAYVARRPSALYYLGRSYFANANYGSAVRMLERYVSVQTAARGPLLPVSAGAAANPTTKPASKD